MMAKERWYTRNFDENVRRYLVVTDFLLKIDEPPTKMKCISVPVVADQVCRDLFPMFWGYGMVCAGQVDRNNCLVRTETNDLISSASAAALLYVWIESVRLFVLQSDDGSVMVCDGQLQGVHWYNHGCTSPPDPSTYTKICKYNSWIRDVMRSYSPTLPPTLPPTTPRVKENKDAEGLKSVPK